MKPEALERIKREILNISDHSLGQFFAVALHEMLRRGSKFQSLLYLLSERKTKDRDTAPGG